MKQYIYLATLATVIITMSGCVVGNNKNLIPKSAVVEEVKQATETTDLNVKPIDCGTDAQCADQMVGNCTHGTFFIGGFTNVPQQKFTVKEKANGKCVMDFEYIDKSVPGLSGSMTCLIPPSVTTAEGAEKYLSGSAFKDCNGTLKDEIFKPVTELVPSAKSKVTPTASEPVLVVDCERDPDCAGNVLADCHEQSFLVTNPDGSEFLFKKVVWTGNFCFTKAEYIKNADPTLVGPQMTCYLPRELETLADIKTLIKNKFVYTYPTGEIRNVCNGSLSKLLNSL